MLAADDAPAVTDAYARRGLEVSDAMQRQGWAALTLSMPARAGGRL